MVSFYDVDSLLLNKALAKEMQSIGEIKAPEWASFVKTGTHKNRPPVDKDWWYARSAAILITIAKKGPIGVNKLYEIGYLPGSAKEKLMTYAMGFLSSLYYFA